MESAFAYELFLLASPEPPPLTPPLKGEGGADLSESPSPLGGGVRGGGPIKDSESICDWRGGKQ